MSSSVNTAKSDLLRYGIDTYSNYRASISNKKAKADSIKLKSGLTIGKNLYTMWNQNQNALLEKLSGQTIDFTDESGVAQSVKLYEGVADQPGFFENLVTPAIDKVNIDRDNIIMAIKEELNIMPSKDTMDNAAALDKYILEHIPKLEDKSIDSSIKAAFELEDEAAKGWYQKFSESAAGKTLSAINYAGQVKGVSEDIKAGDVDAGTVATAGNLALKGMASATGQKIITKFIGEEAAKAVSSTAAGPVGTILSVLSTLASLNDLSRTITKSRAEAKKKAKEAWIKSPHNPANWVYQGKVSDWT